MEKAVYLTGTNQIQKVNSDFDIIYFGEEFCDWLVPSPEDYNKAVVESINIGKKCSCILPYFTESNINKLPKILKAIKKFSCEIIVNDFGSLFYIYKNFPNFTPVLGRLLTKQRRCIPINSKEKMSLREKEYLSTTAISLPVTEKLLKKYKIKRIEIDNLIGGIKALSSNSNLKQSLYYPYGYLTTTHHCFFTHENGHWRKKTKNKCDKLCYGNNSKLHYPSLDMEIFLRGNTQFFKNAKLPADLTSLGIDRIIDDSMLFDGNGY